MMTSKTPLVYVCGEAFLNTSTDSPSVRDVIVSNLVVRWATRTHPHLDKLDPRKETNMELFQTISNASVFVLIFSKRTLEDSFFLNQYGIAKSYNVPIVSMRLTNYFLRNPLPEQFYRTEIIDNSGNESNDQVKDKHAAGKTLSLADHLIADFQKSMVYGRDFHKSCIERLIHKVSKVCDASENVDTFPERSFENFANMRIVIKRNEKSHPPTKCPKCGFLVANFSPPKLQRASSTGSLLRRSHTFEHLPSGGQRNQKTPIPRNRAPLQPATIKIPGPQSTKPGITTGSPSSGNWTQKLDRKQQVQTEAKLQSRARSLESQLEETKTTSPLPNPVRNPKVFRRQSRASNGSWTDRLRSKLRRQSSLPVIPTTYLVTTPDGFEKQISLVRYPPEKRDPSSPRGSDGSALFSEDEDQEIIHISRVPSPDAPSG